MPPEYLEILLEQDELLPKPDATLGFDMDDPIETDEARPIEESPTAKVVIDAALEVEPAS